MKWIVPLLLLLLLSSKSKADIPSTSAEQCVQYYAAHYRVLGRAAQRLIALTGTLMGGYADDLFNIFYRMEPRVMVAEGFAYGGQGRRDFQEQYGVLET